MSRRSKKQQGKSAAIPTAGGDSRKAVAGICVLLAVLVFLVFGRTIYHGFVNFDDDQYVYQNAMVSRGLTMEGVAWAFTHSHAANWHPLTTISHMLDCQLYRLRPGGHHLTNVLLHAAAAVLLFLILREMTGAQWRSAVAAAVFAIHPLRVESVAWVSERKDVLSGVFFMLTIWAYVRYARRPDAKMRHAMVALWLALGLMSKPMLVTTPFVLLLLDYWPLGRLQRKSQLPGLVREKIPLFALSAASCAVTIIAQKQAIQPVGYYPLSLRIGNALVAYCIYLEKTVWPARLAVFHPILKNGWPAWEVIGAILLLAALTAWAWALRRKQPYLIVGWLWYLGMLVTVIGILQVGGQAYADRYTYLPQIGLCIAGIWAVADLVKEWRHGVLAAGSAAAVVVCVLAVAAFQQAAFWRDSGTLWRSALERTDENYLAHNNLGSALFQQGRMTEAMEQYREALRINPDYAEAHNNLGSVLFREGQRNTDRAIAEYREALRINPGYAQAHYNLGNALLQQAKTDDAIGEYREALRINPDYGEAIDNLGNALLEQGKTDDAIAEYREALRINPADAEACDNIGSALASEGKTEEAIGEYREAVRIDPGDAQAGFNLGNALFQQGKAREAIAIMRKAYALQPGNSDFQNGLAWMLATARDPSLRDGAAAVRLAAQAKQATGGGDAHILRTLAAAYAETGDFSKAIQTARFALQIAQARSDSALVGALRVEVMLYEQGRRVAP